MRVTAPRLSTQPEQIDEWPVPVIDIAPLTWENHSDRAKVVAALTAAVLSHGIFAVVGHGIPDDVMQWALLSTKVALQEGGSADIEGWAELLPQPSAVVPPGFVPAYSENYGRVGTDGAKAPPESIHKYTVYPPSWDFDPSVRKSRRNVWPDTAAGEALREPLETYFDEAQRVSDVLHGALSEDVGQPTELISKMLMPHTEGLLRAMCYHPAHPTMAAHKDLGTTTLHLADAPGLEFQPRGREDWVAAAAPQGALLVIIGEFFELRTQGVWRATPHRVTGVGDQGRCSLVFCANQGIPYPEDGSPVNRTIRPLPAFGDEEAWGGLETSRTLGGAARHSIEWPAFFNDAMAAVRSKVAAEEIVAARLHAAVHKSQASPCALSAMW
eukprot:CAMPEP_0203909556 /NCGR_PEP_ID=MMETSP0359-20131031/50844_1 /ASSEMBLY_ACC=CAM_ASM_000338 /TAXON_ID=268821 /ORGANISM="Scrippsiella Hangoei, Strain SHTV-5" /LENGTH=383 /DNA_ID=CAMNT_0050834823 /DNA_START=91 /DNA_END=1239 /DNA_ORIENTATION=-